MGCCRGTVPFLLNPRSANPAYRTYYICPSCRSTIFPRQQGQSVYCSICKRTVVPMVYKTTS